MFLHVFINGIVLTPQGTTHSDVHHTDHSVAPQVEPHLAIPLITDSNTSKLVHQLASYPVTLFDTGFYDLINNSDTWYSYIHGYPFDSPGGFYLLEISRNDGHIRIFQCDVQPECVGFFIFVYTASNFS